MIDFSPFWESLKKSDESTYTLIKKHGISSSTIDRLRQNKPINTTTINDLCRILHCNVDGVLRFIPEMQDE